MIGAVEGNVAPLPRHVVTNRGSWAMTMFIVTEATLFVCLLFAYYFLGHLAPQWPPVRPEWHSAVIMLVVLLSSSGVLYGAERSLDRGRVGQARAATVITAAMGIGFLALQAREYAHFLEIVRPSTNAYGSIFYAITSVHAAHVVLGILMLTFVVLLPEIGDAPKPPHRPLHNAALYWHFVDAVWLVIVVLLYVVPNLPS